MFCPKCKQKIEKNSLKCTNCGTKIGSICTSCGTYNLITAKECSKCNKVLIRICSECGAANLPNASNCRKCGIEFINENEQPVVTNTINPAYQATMNS